MEQTLSVTIVADPRPDVRIVKLAGPLTIHNFSQFQDVTRRPPLPRLTIVDLTDVPYIDSAALGSFVRLHVSCEANGRKYALIGPNERLQALFEMTHVKSFLVICATQTEAEKLA